MTATQRYERVVARHRARCYPNAAQRAQLDIEFECARVVYNQCVAMADWCHRNELKYPGYVGFNKALAVWKGATGWNHARLASNCCQQNATLAAHKAFVNFFRRVRQGEGAPGYPKMKKDGAAEASVTYNVAELKTRWNPQTGILTLTKQKEPLKINWDRRGFPQGAKSVTVIRDAAGRYFVSFTCQRRISRAPGTGASVGIDIGARSDGTNAVARSDAQAPEGIPVFLSPGRQRRFLRLKRKLARQTRQRRVNGRKVWSNSRQRTKRAIARLEARIADARRCWQDGVSRRLVRDYDLIAVEDLNIKGMTKAPAPKVDETSGRYLPNRARAKAKLARNMLNVGAYTLRRQIEYKALWTGKLVFPVNPAYTSQACSCCGSVSAENRKSQSQFICVDCGASMNADINAARNILSRALLDGSIEAATGRPGDKAVGGVSTELMREEGKAQLGLPGSPEKCTLLSGRLELVAGLATDSTDQMEGAPRAREG